MSPEEVTNLMRESSRAGAQDAIAEFEAKDRLNQRAYLAIDSPATALSVLGALAAAILYLVSAETRPLQGNIDTNRENIEKNENSIENVRKETLQKLNQITDFFMKKE